MCSRYLKYIHQLLGHIYQHRTTQISDWELEYHLYMMPKPTSNPSDRRFLHSLARLAIANPPPNETLRPSAPQDNHYDVHDYDDDDDHNNDHGDDCCCHQVIKIIINHRWEDLKCKNGVSRIYKDDWFGQVAELEKTKGQCGRQLTPSIPFSNQKSSTAFISSTTAGFR